MVKALQQAVARILVVDDEAADRQLFRKILEKGGHSVAESSSGQEALRAIQKTPFELMILDLSMPETDGFEVLRVVRSQQPQLKTIAVSGLMQGRLLDSAKILGATATLEKLMAQDLLLTMVNRLLQV
ncbi:MAG TPA: response regulator [Terriglobia bacterium]